MAELEASQLELMQRSRAQRKDGDLKELMLSQKEQGWFTWPQFPRAGEPLQVPKSMFYFRSDPPI